MSGHTGLKTRLVNPRIEFVQVIGRGGNGSKLRVKMKQCKKWVLVILCLSWLDVPLSMSVILSHGIHSPLSVCMRYPSVWIVWLCWCVCMCIWGFSFVIFCFFFAMFMFLMSHIMFKGKGSGGMKFQGLSWSLFFIVHFLYFWEKNSPS